MTILIQVGSLIGILPTIALVVLTAVIGVWLLRLEGLATWIRVQEKLTQGEVPGVEMLEGIMLIVGGTLLLTPGFFTDTIGFICLIPIFRRPLARKLIDNSILSPFLFRSGQHSTFGSSHGFQFKKGPFKDSQSRGADYEGEYRVVDDEPPTKHIETDTDK